MEDTTKGLMEAKRADGKYKIQAFILKEMMAIDKERALITIEAWVKFLEFASGRQHDRIFTTMKDYIPYRCKDVGEWWVIKVSMPLVYLVW